MSLSSDNRDVTYLAAGMSASTRHFVRHYVEMVAVMFAGMGILMFPTGLALNAIGSSMSALHNDAPAAMLFVMAVTMTAPMVGWMRYRGHRWRDSAEMSGAMFVPAFAVIALLWGGLVEDLGALLVFEHVAMLLAMVGAMLLRRDEYSHGDHRRARNAVPA